MFFYIPRENALCIIVKVNFLFTTVHVVSNIFNQGFYAPVHVLPDVIMEQLSTNPTVSVYATKDKTEANVIVYIPLPV